MLVIPLSEGSNLVTRCYVIQILKGNQDLAKNSVFCFGPQDIHICLFAITIHQEGFTCNISGCLTAFTKVLSFAGAILLLGYTKLK